MLGLSCGYACCRGYACCCGYGTQLLAFLGVGLRRESPSSASPVWPLWLWSSAQHGEAVWSVHLTRCTREVLSAIFWRAVPTLWHRIHAREEGKFSQLDRARLGRGLLYYSLNKYDFCTISLRCIRFSSPSPEHRSTLRPPARFSASSPSHLSSLFLLPFSLSSTAREVSTAPLSTPVQFPVPFLSSTSLAALDPLPSINRPREDLQRAQGQLQALWSDAMDVLDCH